MSSFKRETFPTVMQAFLNQVKTRPNVLSFHYKEGTEWKGITWKEFYENVQFLSIGLMNLGAKKGDKICIVANTSLEWLASDVAIMGVQGITVPIYASNTAEDAAYIINHCEAKILFAENQKQLEKILSVKHQLPNLQKIIVYGFQPGPTTAETKDVISLAALRELGQRALTQNADLGTKFENNLRSTKANDIFTICYTSGTTGVPKGVVLTHDSLMSIISDVDVLMRNRIDENDVLLSFLPMSHILGKVENMAAFHFGWKVYYAESIEKVFLNIGEVKPTLLFAVPRIFEKAYTRIKGSIDESTIVKRKLFAWAYSAGEAYYQKLWNKRIPTPREFLEYQLAKKIVLSKIYAKFGGRLKYCVAGGAPLPKAIGEFMRIVGIPVMEGYGLTETCAPITLNAPEALKFGSVGRPLPEVSVKIADDGEVLAKSRKVFKEYYKNADATAEAIDKEGWFHTGDIGIIDDDGYLKITDRKKDLIVTSAGKNVAPQKIENLAKTHKYINQIMVHGDGRNYLTALIVLDKEETIKFAKEQNILFSEYTELVKNPKVVALVQKLVDEVNGHLASYESVKRFTILAHEFTVDAGEMTPSLKIRRRFCMEKYKKELDALYK